jgi:ubiquinone biosynthesis protein
MAFAVLRRGGEGLLLIACLGVNYLLAARLRRWWPSAGERWRSATHAWGAPWFASYCRRHGALLIKLGQAVASRPDLLPLVYVDACAALRDQAPKRPFAEVRPTLEHAYEKRIAEHLPWIDEVALASASFGQVHRARLPDGTLVAIKIQHPDLGPKVAMDLALLRLALRLFALVTPGWPTGMVYDEIARTSHEEQDYLCEADAAERLRPLLARHRVLVPQVRREHTREHVLVMEFAAGATLASIRISDLEPRLRRDFAERIIDAWLDMALEEGFFHGDPHAGNFIVDGDKLWLIDFGMTASLGASQRVLYTRFLVCVASGNTDGMIDVLTELGVVLPGADLDGLKALAREVYSQLAHLNPRAFKNSRREQDISEKVASFLRRMQGLAFPRHTILLTRALGLVEGLIGELVPEEGLLTLARPRLTRLANVRSRLRDLFNDARERLKRFYALPERIERLLSAPRSGPDFTPLLTALVLIAAMQAPEPWRPWAVGFAGGALLLSVMKRR